MSPEVALFLSLAFSVTLHVVGCLVLIHVANRLNDEIDALHRYIDRHFEADDDDPFELYDLMTEGQDDHERN